MVIAEKSSGGTVTTIHVSIPGEPVAQGRPRFARRGNFMVAYDPAKSRNWKATAQAHFREALAAAGIATPLQGPVECRILARFTCPKSDWRKREPVPERLHMKRPDAENVAKAVLDSATGVVWLDDAQVAELTVKKVIGAQGEAPGLEVEIVG
jgi:Holliday junction resolvase RusA-like endonuclease